jgi:hypothetical protein
MANSAIVTPDTAIATVSSPTPNVTSRSDARSASGSHSAYDQTGKTEFNRDRQMTVRVMRTFDRVEDRYVETITDSGGEVIRHKEGRVSDHRGHGADRTSEHEPR